MLRTLLPTLVAAALSLSPSVHALQMPESGILAFDGMGFFGSIDDDTSAGRYSQTEFFLTRDFAWQGTTDLGLSYEASLFVGGGWYEQDDDILEYITVGPVMRVGPAGSNLAVELGIRPGILFDSTSPGRDFGGTVTFFDHIGLLWEPMNGITVGYRYQHMSNGSLYSTNPGINMHLADIRVAF